MSLLFALILAQSTTDAYRLRTALPTIELLADERMNKAFQPYFDCYLSHIRADARTDLADDQRTGAMFQEAALVCASQCEAGQASAQAILGGSSSAATIEIYRRLAGLQRLKGFFAERGNAESFDRYMARLYRGEAASSKVNKSAQD